VCKGQEDVKERMDPPPSKARQWSERRRSSFKLEFRVVKKESETQGRAKRQKKDTEKM
jgi:hypothetical protein